MAERRMFAKTIIDSDSFLDMPLSAQALYFHLSMRADDEGFVNNPKKIQRMVGASDDDARLLLAKRFILAFESGVIVIKHWKIHNYVRSDRFKETLYTKEKSMLKLDEKNAYTEADNSVGMSLGIPNGYQMDTQVSIGKVSIGTDSIGDKHTHGEFSNVLLTDDEYQKLTDKGLLPYIERLSSYIASTGKRYKSHYATILNWSRKDEKAEKPKGKLKSKPTYDINSIQARSESGADIEKLLEELG